MGSDAKVYTLGDVSQHNSAQDCWLIIGGKVYNVTRFLEDHPGGDEVLLSATVLQVLIVLPSRTVVWLSLHHWQFMCKLICKDATDDFEDVGHSDTARVMMEEYYVGEIDPSSLPSKPTHTSANQAHHNSDKSSNFTIKILQFLVPLAILGLAILIRYHAKSS